MGEAWAWKSPQWAHFTFDISAFASDVAQYMYLRGILSGKAEEVEDIAREQFYSTILADETLGSYQIEGERLSAASVWSSLARRLDIANQHLPNLYEGKAVKNDAASQNAAEVVFDAVDNISTPLDEKRVCDWHRTLLAAVPPIHRPPMVGTWRTEPVYIINTRTKDQSIEYEGVPFETIPAHMADFFAWLSGEAAAREIPLVQSAIAHLWFVFIHPFGDGNGRLARAVADNVLSRAEAAFFPNVKDRPFHHLRYFSMSAQILQDRNTYYALLNKLNRSTDLDITEWIAWYVRTAANAVQHSIERMQKMMDTRRLVQHLDTNSYNARQIAMLSRLAGGNFIGKLTTEKWSKLQKCTVYTAGRDIKALVEAGLLQRSEASGRSTSYTLPENFGDLLIRSPDVWWD